MGYAIDDENKFTIAPDVNAKITFAERTSLYATVTGGLNDNDYLQTFLENRYVSPLSRIAYSRTLYDVVAGIKIGVLSGFEFDIFGGYKHTKDDHLYLFNRSNIELNIPSPVYGDISEGHVGGLFKTNIIPYTDLTLKAKAHFYDVTYDPAYTSADSFTSVKRAWGKPKFTFDANVDVKPLDKLILTLNYIYKGGRETFTSDVVKMKDINELNFRTEYKFIDWLSVNLTFNNILNQKYETFYGYTHQGFNVMGGVSLIF